MKKASILARFVALLIDMAILLFFCVAVFIAALSGYRVGSGGLTFVDLSCILFVSSLLSCLIFILYFTYLTTREGMTAGKRIMGIRVIRRDGAGVVGAPGFLRSLVRSLAYILSAMICFIGFLMAPFFRGKALHDIISGTEVICGEPPDTDGGDSLEGEPREKKSPVFCQYVEDNSIVQRRTDETGW
jgi:uncharacterized RDD family membrane protein YckC